MQIDRIEEMRLTDAEETEITALLAASFGGYMGGFGGKSFFQQRQNLRLVAREEGRIVGHMGLCYRAVRLGDDLIDIVGLGDVATLPKARGKGIASALMKASIEEAKQTRAAFFVLFGDRPLYAGHGFQNVAGPVRFIDLADARTGAVTEKHNGSLMVLPLGVHAWTQGQLLDLVGHSF